MAPGNFKNISIEVLSLHAVLKEGEEKLPIHTLPTTKAERLNLIKEGCEKVLIDLQSLVVKYESLGTQSTRTWDRMRWGNEDLAEIRARLTSNISMLTAFIISTTQASVENKLDKLIQEFCRGNREPPTVSFQTVDSLSADDRAVWRTIRKELERIGISLAVFDANRNFIFDWFIHAVKTGAFEEQRVHVIDDESNCYDGRKPQSREEHGDHETRRRIEHAYIGSLRSANEEKAPARQRSPQSAHDLDLSPPRPGPKKLEYVFTPTQATRKDKRRVPWAAALLAELSRPRQRLIKAVETRDVSKALKILKDKASFHLLDTETLDRALLKASRQNGHPSLYLIVSELIARGGNVDSNSGTMG